MTQPHPLDVITSEVALRPVTFRLPKPLEQDPHFGFSRAFYFEAERRGWWKLIRICAEGRTRGITLVPYAEVEQFVRAKMEAQK
jgi:hypothetical protein